MLIYVDIDNTICVTRGTDYPNSQPRYDQIAKINKLYDQGNEIIYWTARGSVSGMDWTLLTKQQLTQWGAKHHDVKLGKPHYDLFICDKSKRIEEL
jgi:dTDP-glucose 4,6-dehydratase